MAKARINSGGMRRIELRVKLDFAVRVENDFDAAFLLFMHGRAGALVLAGSALAELRLDGAAVLQPNAVVVDGAGGKGIDAEAGAGVVDFEQIDCVAGVVEDRDINVRRFAAGQRENERKQERGREGFGTRREKHGAPRRGGER